MTAKRLFYALVGVLIFFIAGSIATLYFGNMFMKKSSNSLVNSKLDNIQADAEELTYLQSRKDLEKYSDLNATIAKVLPKTKDQALAVSELYKIGDETGIVINRIQFPNSTLGQKVAKPSAGSSTNQSATTPATPSVTQAKAVDGITGVLGIDIDIGLQPARGLSISYDNMIKFLQKVEANRRNMQIKDISVHADVKNGGVTFDATITIFVKP